MKTIPAFLMAAAALGSMAAAHAQEATAPVEARRGAEVPPLRATVEPQYLTPPRALVRRDDVPVADDPRREESTLPALDERERDVERRLRDRIARTPQHGSNATGFGPLPSTAGQPGILQ